MPEQVQRYRRWLTAQQKDERQANHDRRRLHISTRAIYFDRRMCSTASSQLCFDHCHFVQSNFPRARHEAHYAHVYT